MFKNKKMILLMGGLAAASFAGSYLVTGLLGIGTPPAPLPSEGETAEQAPSGPAEPVVLDLSPKEAMLDHLISELRAKMDLADAREKELETREKRLAIAERKLKDMTRSLDDMRLEIAASFEPLKRELDRMKEQLEQSEHRISADERANLKRIAAIFDKMDTAAAGEILAEKCKSNQLDEAVGILRYMRERSAASVLAEMSDKSLAAKITERLQRVTEETLPEG